MKPLFKQILKYYLKYLTKLALFIHRPMIICVAGNSNKYFIKEEIKGVLKEKGLSVRANPRNFNTEIGMPLSILYLKSGYNCYMKWLPIVFSAPRAVFDRNFPKYLVLELGISKPGDMKYLLSIVKPNISIIYSITQQYLDGFPNFKTLIGEYEYLAKRTKDLLILNHDIIRVRDMAPNANCDVNFISIKEQTDCRAVNIQKVKDGQDFEIYKNNEKYSNVHINKFGEHHVYTNLIGTIIKDKF